MCVGLEALRQTAIMRAPPIPLPLTSAITGYVFFVDFDDIIIIPSDIEGGVVKAGYVDGGQQGRVWVEGGWLSCNLHVPIELAFLFECFLKTGIMNWDRRAAGLGLDLDRSWQIDCRRCGWPESEHNIVPNRMGTSRRARMRRNSISVCGTRTSISAS